MAWLHSMRPVFRRGFGTTASPPSPSLAGSPWSWPTGVGSSQVTHMGRMSSGRCPLSTRRELSASASMGCGFRPWPGHLSVFGEPECSFSYHWLRSVPCGFSHCRVVRGVDRSTRVHLRSPWLAKLAAVSAWDNSFRERAVTLPPPRFRSLVRWASDLGGTTLPPTPATSVLSSVA